MRRRLERALGSRLAIPVLIACGVALCATSLGTGRVADDFIEQQLLGHHALPGMTRRPLDLFTFATGKRADTHALMDAGAFPWWADPDVRLSFFRPLSALTHALDYALWPDSPALEHAQNLLWFALALLAVAALYRRLLPGPPWLVGLAVALYALDDAHGPAVGWIANRNAMVALALSLPALLFYDRFRKSGWRPGALLGPLFLALGLLAGESAIACCGYLFAYALFLDRGPLARRLLRLWPYALVVILWRVVYHALGHGAAHSGVYLDPIGQPAAFLAALPRRFTALLAGQLALPWSDFSAFYPFISARLTIAMALLAAATVVGIGWLLWPLLRRDPVARFFALGLLLATIPICATFPADRLLWFVGIGAMALLAQRIAVPEGGVGAKIALGLLIFLHLGLAPPLLALRARSMDTVKRPLERVDRSLPRDPAVIHKTVVIVDTPADLFAGFFLTTRAGRGEPLPAHVRWLASGTTAVELFRPDARTLELRPRGGFYQHMSERMLRSPDRPLPAGSRITLTGLEIEVIASLPDGRPAAVRFRFAVPLEDPSLDFVLWQGDRYRPFALPPIGAHVTLPPLDFLKAVFAP